MKEWDIRATRVVDAIVNRVGRKQEIFIKMLIAIAFFSYWTDEYPRDSLISVSIMAALVGHFSGTIITRLLTLIFGTFFLSISSAKYVAVIGILAAVYFGLNHFGIQF